MKTKYTIAIAVSIVIANIVGTGVFTSLGFQLETTQSEFALMSLWVIGGIAALCGALSYAEIGAALPRSGGEYNFLTRIYHPGAGFVAGWVSSTIGFSAPVALVAITFAAYLRAAFLPDMEPATTAWIERVLAVSLILIVSTIHASRRRYSGQFQYAFTLIKVLCIFGFSLAVIFALDTIDLAMFAPSVGDVATVTSGGFAVALIYVTYAYSGWSAATYLTGEMTTPQSTLPKALLWGTSVVLVLYLLLNAVFLLAVPKDLLVGEVEVGVIAARHVFGEVGAKVMGVMLAILLISTASAMTMAGPRVLQMIGQDISIFKFLAKENRDGLPMNAIGFQSGLAIVFVLTGTFDQILVFAGFTLALINLVTVAGVFVLRTRLKHIERPFKTPFYPWVPLIYLALTGWTLIYVGLQRHMEVLFALLVLSAGAAMYLASRRYVTPR